MGFVVKIKKINKNYYINYNYLLFTRYSKHAVSIEYNAKITTLLKLCDKMVKTFYDFQCFSNTM